MTLYLLNLINNACSVHICSSQQGSCSCTYVNNHLGKITGYMLDTNEPDLIKRMSNELPSVDFAECTWAVLKDK